MILVADSNRVSGALLSATLTDAGHSVLEASDEKQAWDLICRHAPPIVILDGMSGGGLELCRRIRCDQAHAAVYVIVLTPSHGGQDIAAALAAGADDCLARPVSSDELQMRLMVAQRAVDARTESRRVIGLQLRQTQRLEAIGQLAAGLAHEINTPMQYIGDNVRFLGDSVAALDSVLALLIELTDGRCAQTAAEIGARVGAADLPFLRTHMTRAAAESVEGVEHVSRIVRAMREFSHPGAGDREPLDLNRAIETILVLARNDLKYIADVHLQLDPALPLVPCLATEVRQALLNLVINAAHSVGDAVAAAGTGSRGAITVWTRVVEGEVEIRIDDTGLGIPEGIRDRVFEAFFTTKEAGRGTGQGLALAHATIVEQHNGRIWFESVPGRGTTFFVRLPR
jgi:signal transduction histidine kinase